MRVIGTIILALLASLSMVSSVSAQDSPLLLSSINLSSASVTEGRSVEATVTLNMAAPGNGAKVSLAVDPAGSAMVPASVTVPAGATSATFPVKVATRYFRHHLRQLRRHQERVVGRDAPGFD